MLTLARITMATRGVPSANLSSQPHGEPQDHNVASRQPMPLLLLCPASLQSLASAVSCIRRPCAVCSVRLMALGAYNDARPAGRRAFCSRGFEHVLHGILYVHPAYRGRYRRHKACRAGCVFGHGGARPLLAVYGTQWAAALRSACMLVASHAPSRRPTAAGFVSDGRRRSVERRCIGLSGTVLVCRGCLRCPVFVCIMFGRLVEGQSPGRLRMASSTLSTSQTPNGLAWHGSVLCSAVH